MIHKKPEAEILLTLSLPFKGKWCEVIFFIQSISML